MKPKCELTELEKTVLALRKEGLTYREIAVCINRSKSRPYAIFCKARLKLGHMVRWGTPHPGYETYAKIYPEHAALFSDSTTFP